MKKGFSLVCIGLLCFGGFFAGGCWSRREVENLAIVGSLGVDRDYFHGVKKYRVTCNVFRPSQVGGGGGGGQSGGGGSSAPPAPVWQVSAMGDTVNDAFANLSTRSPRDIFLGHVRLIILGKDIAKEGVSETVDFFLRNRDVRLRTWMMVVDGKAEEALRAAPGLESTISMEGTGVANLTRNAVSKYYLQDLNQLVNSMASGEEEALLGRVEIVEPPAPQPGTATMQKSLAYRGSAVFRSDRLVGWLEDNETKGFLFITGQARRGVVPIIFPGAKTPKLAVEMLNSSSQVAAEIKDGKLYVKVKIEAQGSLKEQGDINFTASPQGLEKLGELYAAHIRQICQKTVDRAQQYKADIFGFGAELHRQHPQQWQEAEKDWPAIFAKAQVEIQVKGTIRRTGLLSETIRPGR